MNQGWISLHRKLKDNPIYRNSVAVHIWVECLLRAAHKRQEFYSKREKVVLQPGQFLMGYKEFGETIGISKTATYYWMKILSDEGLIEHASTTKGTVVTIENWARYQSVDHGKNTERTRKEPYNNVNNVNKREIESEISFKEERKTRGYLLSIPKDDIQRLTSKYQIMEKQIVRKGEELHDYVVSKGKIYKNYFAFLQGAIRRDFGYRRVNKVPDYSDVPVNKEGLKKLAETKEKLFGKPRP